MKPANPTPSTEKKALELPDAASDAVKAQTQITPTVKPLPDEDGEVWQDLGEELYRMRKIMSTPVAQTDEESRCSTPEYRSWSHMRGRCSNTNNPAYHNYGGRGIKVCSRWDSSFDNFLADVGRRPAKGYTLHRKRNDGHYEPGNVVWADWITQNNSRRGNRVITVFGEAMTVAEAGRRFNKDCKLIHQRIVRHGWPEERAATQPAGPHKSRKHCV